MKRSKHSFLIRQTDRQLDPVVRALDVKQQSQYRKRLVEGRQETTVLNSQCSNANDLRTLRQVEQAIFEAQDRCVVFAEGIEVECQKEKFFDQEIRLLQDKLSSLRARKELTSKNKQPAEASAGEKKDQRTLRPASDQDTEAELRYRIDRTQHLLNDTKARNVQLRTVIDNLR